MRKLSLAGVVAVLLVSASSANAGIWTYDFTSPAGTLGTTQPYTANSVTITALGFDSLGNPINLFGKTDGGDESGLGLAGQPHNEIQTNNFIQLDILDLQNKYPSATLSMILGSVQDGESGNIYGSNIAGNLGTYLFTVTDESSFGVPTSYRYVGVTAGAEDILISSLTAVSTANPVPVPPSMLLALTGLGLCGGWTWRRRRAAIA